MRQAISPGRDQHCGLRFAAVIEVASWIDRAGPVGQQRIDAAIADYRKKPTPPVSFAVLPTVMSSGNLGSLSADILQICERMVGMPDMTIGIAEQILKIEAAARSIETFSGGRP